MQTATPAGQGACAFDGKVDTWVEEECAACVFKDLRLKRRFVGLLKNIARCIGGSIPFVCQDWANTKAAYRFLSNELHLCHLVLTGPQKNQIYDVPFDDLTLHS